MAIFLLVEDLYVCYYFRVKSLCISNNKKVEELKHFQKHLLKRYWRNCRTENLWEYQNLHSSRIKIKTSDSLHLKHCCFFVHFITALTSDKKTISNSYVNVIDRECLLATIDQTSCHLFKKGGMKSTLKTNCTK